MNLGEYDWGLFSKYQDLGMALKQSTLCQISQSIKSLVLVVLCVLVFMPTTRAFAEPINYGPTKSGDTLWEIAKKNLPNQSLSVEQFVYSIYITNPSAFQSGNINQLLKGVTLTMPDTDNSMKTSKLEAKKLITILQADAKQVSRAKINSRKFNKQIKKYGRQLRKYRRHSRAWKRVYRKLARSKKNLAVSNRKIVRLNKLLRDRANLKSAELSKEKTEKASTTATVVENPVSEKIKDTSSSPVEMTEISQQKVEETNKVLSKLSKDEEKTTKKQQLASSKQVVLEAQKNVQKTTQETKSIPTNNVVGGVEIPDPIKEKQLDYFEQKNAQIPLPSTNKEQTDWLTYLSENLILIAGIINGIILLFVLFKIFEKKEEPDFISE